MKTGHRHSGPGPAALVGFLAVAAGCSSQKVFTPPEAEQPRAHMTAKFLNVRHEPNAPWGKRGFRPRLEICDGRQPGCGLTWCYECPDDGSERTWAISATSVAALLPVPTREITIVPYTREGGDECRADPLVISPKEGLEYELVYSHVWSGPEAKSYRCAATIQRKAAAPAAPSKADEAKADVTAEGEAAADGPARP